MDTIYSHYSGFSKYNLDDKLSDIQIFINEYKERIQIQLAREFEKVPMPFVSFNENKFLLKEDNWLEDNYQRFFKDTPNEFLVKESYLSELGFIMCMKYSPNGEFVIVGHSTGLIQIYPRIWYPMFSSQVQKDRDLKWVYTNKEMFLDNTPNSILTNRWFLSECGYITALVFTPDGEKIVVGHANGLIQMRNGRSGIVLATLRNIQFPPRPIYALEFSKIEERICYAACSDGTIYRIEVPNIETSPDGGEYCIRVDPALEWLNTQFYGSPGISMASTPFITQRSPALSMSLTADNEKLVVGYEDTSIKVYDAFTQESVCTYKVHKLRLQFIPKKLQRVHFGQVVAVRCHREKHHVFATAAWDKTLRIWDTRCKVGCMMTFEGVNICHDAIDLCRDQCIAGSWKPTNALAVWDLTARKRLNVIRVQNRRPDVDGEYVYCCRYWRSPQYNRKGKYGIIGGSGTNCLEVINLHNRYITCSYPAPGTVLAITSFEDRIAFGGTAPVFNIVSFHDPKHEKYSPDIEPDFDYTENAVTLFARDVSSDLSEKTFKTGETKSTAPRMSTAGPKVQITS